MADLHHLADYREDALTPQRVAEALAQLGGAAHRDMIVDVLLGALARPPARARTAAEVDRILRMHAGGTGPFVQVFGPDSRCWTLKTPPSVIPGHVVSVRRTAP